MMMVLKVIGDEYRVWYDDGANMMKVLMVIEDEYTIWYDDSANGY